MKAKVHLEILASSQKGIQCNLLNSFTEDDRCWQSKMTLAAPSLQSKNFMEIVFATIMPHYVDIVHKWSNQRVIINNYLLTEVEDKPLFYSESQFAEKAFWRFFPHDWKSSVRHRFEALELWQIELVLQLCHLLLTD